MALLPVSSVHVVCTFILLAFVSCASSFSLLERRNSDGEAVSWSQSNQSLCTVLYGRAALVGNQLFFMGANYTSVADPHITSQKSLFALNLNESFPVNQIINSGLYESALPSNVTWAYTTGGVFWYDNTTLYLYNDIGLDHVSNDLWSFDVPAGTWNNLSISGGNFQAKGDRGLGGYASVPAIGQSFFAGGGGAVESGILRFDSSDPTDLTWENKTAPLTVEKIEGDMAYVPVGAQGMLVYMGGYNLSTDGDEYAGSWPYDDAFLTSVDVYDIDSGEWFNVETSGDIPPANGSFGMGQFCHWVTIAPDRSSFQITVYGGWSLFVDRAWENTYVLSLPSFTWIQINTTDNLDLQISDEAGRYGHHCFKWKEDHGFVLGGLIKKGVNGVNLGNGSAQICNPDMSALRLLNLSTFEWQSSYDPNNPSATYNIHEDITKVIGGGSTGGATATAPAGGWSDPKLVSIFSKQPPDYQPPTNVFADAASDSGTPGSTVTPASSSPKKDHAGVNAGVIAGSAVGVVLGLAVIAALCFCYWIRPLRRRNKQAAEAREGNKTLDPKLHPYMDHKAELQGEGRAIQELDPVNGGGKQPELPGSSPLVELHTQEAPVELYAGWPSQELHDKR